MSPPQAWPVVGAGRVALFVCWYAQRMNVLSPAHAFKGITWFLNTHTNLVFHLANLQIMFIAVGIIALLAVVQPFAAGSQYLLVFTRLWFMLLSCWWTFLSVLRSNSHLLGCQISVYVLLPDPSVAFFDGICSSCDSRAHSWKSEYCTEFAIVGRFIAHHRRQYNHSLFFGAECDKCLSIIGAFAPC